MVEVTELYFLPLRQCTLAKIPIREALEGILPAIKKDIAVI